MFSRNGLFGRVDFSLLIPALFLVFLSLSVFYSIDISLFKQQLVFLVFSLLVYFIFLNIDYRVFGFFSNYIYFIMLGLLIFIFLVGIEVKGAVRWIDIAGFRIQFSEVFKPFFVIFLASFLSRDESTSLTKYIKTLLLVFPFFFLTLKQPDLGNAGIYLITSVFMLFMYGFNFMYFAISAVVVAIPLPLLFNLLHDYQKHRVLTFFNATSDPFGSSYNAIQALISVGSGGLFGKGFGQATQSILKFLPERHNDFVFATISETMGFVGSAIVIILFVFLLVRIYKITQEVNNKFSFLVLNGFYFLILTHTFLNIGMNVGIVPIVGITLPFVSYGGSSLLTNFIILGIISSISYESKKRHSFEIR